MNEGHDCKLQVLIPFNLPLQVCDSYLASHVLIGSCHTIVLKLYIPVKFRKNTIVVTASSSDDEDGR